MGRHLTEAQSNPVEDFNDGDPYQISKISTFQKKLMSS